MAAGHPSVHAHVASITAHVDLALRAAPSAGQFFAVIITQLNIGPAIRPRNNHRTRKRRITVIPGRNRGNHIIRGLRNAHRPRPRAQPIRWPPRTRPWSVRHRRSRERHDGNRRAPPGLHLHLPGPRLESGTRIPVIVTGLEAVISERPGQPHPGRRTGSSRTSRTRGQQHTARQQQPGTPTHRRCPRSSRNQSPSRPPRGLPPASGGPPALDALASRGNVCPSRSMIPPPTPIVDAGGGIAVPGLLPDSSELRRTARRVSQSASLTAS
jgi:hypothetical protein